MNIPECPNHIAGACERSSTYVDGERAECYVIKCRTCGGLNVWPKDERPSRYQAGLAKLARDNQEKLLKERQRAYSFGGQ